MITGRHGTSWQNNHHRWVWFCSGSIKCNGSVRFGRKCGFVVRFIRCRIRFYSHLYCELRRRYIHTHCRIYPQSLPKSVFNRIFLVSPTNSDCRRLHQQPILKPRLLVVFTACLKPILSPDGRERKRIGLSLSWAPARETCRFPATLHPNPAGFPYIAGRKSADRPGEGYPQVSRQPQPYPTPTVTHRNRVLQA